MVGDNKRKTKNKRYFNFCLFVFSFAFFTFSFNFTSAYSLDDPSRSSGSLESFFNKNPFQFSPIDINQFIKKDRFNLDFNDLLNTRSFSSQDIGASLKAVLILFIKLTVTTLNVTLGVLRVLLDILTSQF